MWELLDVLFLAASAVAAITAHEYIKAVVSHKLGDPLPRARGRLTLNPMKHLEPVGLICMILTGYGWGKPVETAAVYYKDRKKGIILTYITPSVINLLIGTALAWAGRALLAYIGSNNLNMLVISSGAYGAGAEAGMVALYMAYRLIVALAKANVALAFFNIIPVYPLDGAKILSLVISPNAQVKMTSYEKIFQIILLIAMFSGWARMLLSPLQSVFL